MKIRRNASSERAKTIEASIHLLWSLGIRLFLTDEQHPKGDVLMFQRRHDDCLDFVA